MGFSFSTSPCYAQYMSDSKKYASVGVGVIIQKDGKVLLQKRKGSHGEGKWSCPGGHIDFGETIEEAAIREAKEEVGVTIANVRFKTLDNHIFKKEGKHYVTIWLEADYVRGKPRINAKDEISDVGWFAWDNLPKPMFVKFPSFIKKGYSVIEKKVWPEYFQKILEGKKKGELRLADWKCKPGDILVLREWDPKTKKYTGRKVEKKISHVLKTKKLSWWSPEEVKKYGYQIISFE